MGWDEMYRDESPCDCGKGTYIVVTEMDDWNRTRSHRFINCSVCKEKDRLEKEEIGKDQKRLSELIEDILVYFVKNYMEKWLAYFSTAKNKKGYWNIAANIGVAGSSLSSFYEHNKRRSMEDYVISLANFQNMLKIIDALGIQDDSFRKKAEEAIELDRAIYKRRLEMNRRDSGY